MGLSTRFDDIDQERGTVEATVLIEPNATQKQRTLQRDLGQGDFDPLFDKVAEDYFHSYFSESWAERVAETASTEQLAFSWPDAYRLAEGKEAVDADLRAWYTSDDGSSRGKSPRSWEERLRSKLEEGRFRDRFVSPTLEAAKKALDEAISRSGKGEQLTATITDRPPTLVLSAGKGANPLLKAAVSSVGAVEFLKRMAGGQSVLEVSAPEFSSSDTSQAKLWHWVNPASSKEENKDYVKSRFRTEGGKKGSHEWIPCAKLIDVVDRAQEEEDAEKGALWISLADNMRSKTSNLVFRPQSDAELSALLVGFVKAVASAERNHEAMTEKLRETGTKVDDWNLGGHVGALYLEANGKRTQQVEGTATFHEALGGLWDFGLEPKKYPSVVKGFVEGEKGLWKGDPLDFLPKEFIEPVDYTVDLPSEYNDVTGTSWGENVRALGDEVGTRYDQMLKDLDKAAP